MIEINNLTKVKIDENSVKKVVKKVLKKENKENINLSIAFIGPKRIESLNKKYRGKNQVTDILAFNQELPELIICPRKIRKNAKKYALPFEKELIRCLIHGTLHILGYDHEKSEKKAREMKEKEKYYQQQILKSYG